MNDVKIGVTPCDPTLSMYGLSTMGFSFTMFEGSTSGPTGSGHRNAVQANPKQALLNVIVHFNYLSMKQIFLKSRLLLVALVMGGMFLVSNSASAQATSSVVAPPPNNQSWVSTPMAQQTIQSEMAALTNELNLKVQQGAPQSEIKDLKHRLQFYMYMEEALNAGQPVALALDFAKNMLLRPDAVGYSSDKAAKVQKLYDEIYVKFTV